MKKIGTTKSSKWAYKQLVNNDLDWYVVRYTDGSYDCKHRTGLSSILECGSDMADYDIEQMEQCWNGQELGESPF